MGWFNKGADAEADMKSKTTRGRQVSNQGGNKAQRRRSMSKGRKVKNVASEVAPPPREVAPIPVVQKPPTETVQASSPTQSKTQLTNISKLQTSNKEQSFEDQYMPPSNSDSSEKEGVPLTQSEDSGGDYIAEDSRVTQSHLNSLFNGHLMKWKFEAEEGTIFLRAPAFLGALAQIGVTIAAFILDPSNAREIHAIVMYVCIVTMSILILILEGRFVSSHPLSVRSHLRNIATRNFNILRFLWGRGLMYVTVGVLTIAQMWKWAICAGTYMVFIGILSVIVGVHASRKFAALRNSLADESFLLLVFANYDHDGDGYIDPREFSMILMDLGVELDDRYTLKAFNNIDQEGNRRISFEEFSHWWSSGFVERGRKHMSDEEDEYAYRQMRDNPV